MYIIIHKYILILEALHIFEAFLCHSLSNTKDAKITQSQCMGPLILASLLSVGGTRNTEKKTHALGYEHTHVLAIHDD